MPFSRAAHGPYGERRQRCAVQDERVGIVGALVASVVSAGSTVGATTNNGRGRLAAIDHLVVIYEENHSFDNLYGRWGRVGGRGRRAARRAGPAERPGRRDGFLLHLPAAERRQPPVAGPLPTAALPPPRRLPPAATSPTRRSRIDAYNPSADTTCPPPLQSPPQRCRQGLGYPRGCTRIWCTASTRSSTRSTAGRRTATSSAVT